MNTRKLLSSILFVCILLTACTPAAPPTVVPTATIIVPTAAISTVTPAAPLTTFSSKVFELPMEVNFGQQDWQVSDDFSDLVTVESKQGEWGVSFNLVTSARLANPANDQIVLFPKDFVSWIQSNPDFKVGEPTSVTVGGIGGTQIDVTPIWPPTTANKKLFLALRSKNWNIVPKPERWRFIYLDNVNGKQLLILLMASADQFDTAVEQAQAVLNTVKFTK